jgi:uncharacterized membrane protein
MKKVIIMLASIIPFGISAKVDFKKDIKPLLESRCVSCHSAPYESRGRLRKPKGGYQMDTKENLLKAGDSEEVPVVEGDAEKSYLYKLVNLHEDDDDIMPAKGDAFTTEQKKLIKDWINEGVTWDTGITLVRPTK